jgi:hypothetical protein
MLTRARTSRDPGRARITLTRGSPIDQVMNPVTSWPISPVLDFPPHGKFAGTYFVVEKIDIFTTFRRIYVDPSTDIT